MVFGSCLCLGRRHTINTRCTFSILGKFPATPIRPLRPAIVIPYPCATRSSAMRWRTLTTRATTSADYTFIEKMDQRPDPLLFPEENTPPPSKIMPTADQLADLDPSSMAIVLDEWIQEYDSSRSARVLLKQTCASLSNDYVWTMLNEDGISERLRLHIFRILAARYDGDFDHFLQRVPRSIMYFNTAARACLRINKPDQALLVIEQMKTLGLEADAATFNIFIRAKMIEEDIESATELYFDMLDKRIAPNAATYNIFLRHACRQRSWDDVERWLDWCEEHTAPNGVTLRILLGSLFENHDVVKLVNAFQRVAKRVPITEVDEKLKTGIVALLRLKRSSAALVLLRRILSMDIPISLMACNLLIHAFCQKGDIDAAHQILKSMVRGSKQGEMPMPDVVSYTSLISAYTQCGPETDIVSVLTLYEEMIKLKVDSNAKLQSALLYALIRSKFSNLGRAASLFRRMIEQDDKWKQENVSPTAQTPWVSQTTMYNIMMDGYFLHYGKESHPETLRDAYSLLKEAYEKGLRLTTVTLNIWVRGLAKFDNDLDGADRIIEWFETQSVEPNERTLWYLVKSARHRGETKRARRYLQTFEEKGHVLEGKGIKEIKAMLLG